MADQVESFEVTMGGQSGDMLSARRGDVPLKIGVLACAYFEYWRMYPSLEAEVIADMAAVAARIGKNHEIVYPGLVDTLDKAEAAGRLFKEEQIDLPPPVYEMVVRISAAVKPGEDEEREAEGGDPPPDPN